MGLLSTLLAFVVAISLLVAVHEYGHFAVGRALGFKVLRFSIGFGKPLWRRVGRDGTEYVLAGIPLGGYVKFADEREGPVDDAVLSQAFNRRPVWARIAVLIAGPAANFVFAIAAFWVLFQIGIPGLRPVVGDVTADSLAARAGLRSGDEIVAIGERPVATEESVVQGLMGELSGDGHVALRVRNGTQTRELVIDVPESQRRAMTEPGMLSSGMGFEFSRPNSPPAIIGKVSAGSPAEAAGLKAGDLLTAVDGVAVADFRAFQEQVMHRPGARVTLGVTRAGAQLSLPVTVRGDADPAHPGSPPIGRIGIQSTQTEADAQWPPGMLTVQRFGPLAAIGPAVHETWDKSALTVKMLSRMLVGRVSLKNVSGPISIASYAGITARAGGRPFLTFLALISLSLGILNLVPIPILDGGQIVYQCAEAVRGRPLSERVQALGQQLGVAMLLVLMALAFYNDIARQLG